MLTALDPNRSYYYSLEGDSGEKKTVFLVKPLNSRQWREIKNDLKNESKRGDQIHQVLSWCLIGWENLNDSAGNPCAFDKASIEANLDRLLEPWKDELAAFIMRLSYLGEADAVKSVAPSASR